MGASDDYSPLDDVDRTILQLLQRDARHKTAVEIGQTVGVSDSTVRNRIVALEQQGVIEGYVPLINYEAAGYQLQIRVTCTAPVTDRAELARDALQIEGVIEVRELLSGTENIAVTAVPPKNEDITYLGETLSELGLEVVKEETIRQHYIRPFSYFGSIEKPEEEADDLPGDMAGTETLQ